MYGLLWDWSCIHSAICMIWPQWEIRFGRSQKALITPKILNHSQVSTTQTMRRWLHIKVFAIADLVQEDDDNGSDFVYPDDLYSPVDKDIDADNSDTYSGSLGVVDQEDVCLGLKNWYCILLTRDQVDTIRDLDHNLQSDTLQDALLHAFHRVGVTLSTMLPNNTEKHCFHHPIEAFILISNPKKDGAFIHLSFE